MKGWRGISTTEQGKDKFVRAVQTRVGSKFLKRPIQLFFPLKIYCNVQHIDV